MSEERIEEKRTDDPGEPAPPLAPKPGGFSIRWSLIGALVIVAGITLGDKLLWKSITDAASDGTLSSDAERAALVAATTKGPDKMTDAEKDATRSAVAGDRALVASLALMLLVLPFAVGAVIGVGTKSVLSAAVSVAAGAVAALGMATSGGRAVLVILVAAVVYFCLGALAGLLGRKIARHRSLA
jgi:hypothetical protein